MFRRQISIFKINTPSLAAQQPPRCRGRHLLGPWPKRTMAHVWFTIANKRTSSGPLEGCAGTAEQKGYNYINCGDIIWRYNGTSGRGIAGAINKARNLQRGTSVPCPCTVQSESTYRFKSINKPPNAFLIRLSVINIIGVCVCACECACVRERPPTTWDHASAILLGSIWIRDTIYADTKSKLRTSPPPSRFNPETMVFLYRRDRAIPTCRWSHVAHQHLLLWSQIRT